MPAVTAATPWFSRRIVSTFVTPVGAVEALAAVDPPGVAEALGVVDTGAELGMLLFPAGVHAASNAVRTANDNARRQGRRRRGGLMVTLDRRTRKKRSTLKKRGERRERN